MRLKLKNVRIAFPAIFKAEQYKGAGDFTYAAKFIFPKDSPLVEQINGAMLGAAIEKCGAKAAAVFKSLVAKQAVCMRDGDLSSDIAGFEGSFYLSARNKVKPRVVDQQKRPLDDDGTIYSGCNVNAVVDVWMQKDLGRINASLVGVQFHSDNDSFGGGAPASDDDFEDYEAAEDSLF